jgi:diguanylate cyclase (GGDEF)-like protein
MFAIQTLDAGTFMRDLPEPPGFRHPVAWDHVSGFVVLLNAVNLRYLNAARASGKPVVMVSHVEPGFECPTLLPDNAPGIREAVTHLIAHGHRDIGFAGYTKQRDVRERYEGYLQALRDHGIEPDPRLFVDSGNNQISGGERAARAMMADGLRSTAVVAGNDANAFGLIRTLQAAGYQVPAQQAVVGFDDLDVAVYSSPGLSTVRQQLVEMGEEATSLVFRQLAGEPVRYGSHRVPTEFVARQSCGCPNTLALAGGAASPERPVASRAQLRAEILESLGRPDGAAAPAVDRVAELVEAAVGAATAQAPGPGELAVESALAAICDLAPTPEAIVETMRGIRRYGQHVADRALSEGDGPAAVRATERVLELVQGLGQAQDRARFLSTVDFASTFGVQHHVSMDLLRSHEQDPRALAWLGRTGARAGRLALWVPPGGAPGANGAAGAGGAPGGPDGSADGAALPDAGLELVGAFDSTGPLALAREVTTTRQFPPQELVDVADVHDDRMVFVASVQVGASDWGMLAVAGPIEATAPTGRETMNQWAALLTIALDHEAVLQSLRQQEERMRHAALYDQLTGLANRTLFVDRLKQAIARSRRTDAPFAVLLLDLDGFKLVNDSLGHLAGDRLLVEVAGRIRAGLREGDVAARFGGDEFAVLLEGVDDPMNPEIVADRLNAAIHTPFTLEEQQVAVGASIGIAHSRVGYDNPEDVIRDADIAMYFAKSAGKGTHAVFDVAMHDRAVGRLRIEADLRHALEHREFETHYQPIVDMIDERIVGFEALLRWRHPVRGLIPPAQFLPVAEECRLMPAIGNWVLGEACAQLAAWHRERTTDPPLRMSVNVSNREFWQGDLAAGISDWLDLTGLNPRCLAIEITEGVIMHDVKLAQKTIGQLNEMGVELHIDDFGTGYSSLEVLHQLPIDVLKIDRSFVERMRADSRSRELVRTIVMMGTNLGLRLVAEGVETEAQRDELRELGCRYGQGYWFSRPVPAARAGQLIV